jgi:hypothetical protein
MFASAFTQDYTPVAEWNLLVAIPAGIVGAAVMLGIDYVIN